MAKKPETDSSGEGEQPKTDPQDDVFMREVDEAVRTQEMQDAAKKYGIPVAIALAVGLAGLGGYTWYSNSVNAGKEEASESLVQAMDQLQDGNLETASAAFAPIADGDQSAHAVSARMIQAGIAAQQDKPEEAAKILAEIAADESVPEQLRNLAKIREVGVTFDTLKPEEVIERMKPLAVSGTPWFPHAAEYLAAAYLAQDKPELAGPLLVEIAKDDDAPGSLQSRSRQLAGVLGFDAIKDPEELLEEIGAEAPEAEGPPPAPAQ